MEREHAPLADLPEARGYPHDGVDFPARGIPPKPGADNVVGRDDALQGLEDDLLRRRRDDVEIEAVAVDSFFEHRGEQWYVPFQPHAPPDLEQIFLRHRPVLGIVP